MAIDTAGNSMARARRLAVGQMATAVNEWVGSTDTNDFYRMSFNSRSRLTVGLRASGSGAMAQLIRDSNGNGRLDAGEVVKQGRSLNNTATSFPVVVTAGTYFLRVVRSNGDSSYRLTTSAMSTFLSDVLTLTNQFRQQNGLSALTYNTRLGTAAQGHSQNMALRDFFSHTGLDGSEPWDRVTAAGYQWSRVTENIAAGQRTAQDVVQGWIDSPGHRENMLDPQVTQIGLGYYFLGNDTGTKNYNTYWTQVFARPS